ncbi:MAG: hypothetical protein ACTSXZ_00990 [Alphaproteobacteria bacterium]
MEKLQRIGIVVFVVCLVSLSPAFADELEDRAAAFEEWFNDYHVSPYGGTGYVYFVDPGGFEIERYAFSDSTIWTGAYLAAEAFRYAVTGDEDAKQNAIRTVQALDAHLQVTQVPGFIARFAGPDEPPWNNGYTGHSRYVQGTGEWEGSFWINNTSRDQYTGWFFGMAIAYDLIDDEPTRELIRQDVKEMIDDIKADRYWIIGENGLPTDAGPNVGAVMRCTWHLIAAHVLDNEEYWAQYLERWETDIEFFPASSFSVYNKYDEYFGFNLSHMTWFNLIRLERNPERRQIMFEVFHDKIRWLVEFTHNVFFDDIYLALCERGGECLSYDESLDDLQAQILDFQDPPVREVPLVVPEWPLDPVSVFLSDLIDLLGIRELIDIEYQTKDPRPVKWRCPRSFMWQKTPYNIDCPGGDGTEVYPGIDYLLAYWMGRYYNLIEPGNPNEITWPPDETPPDDDTFDDDTIDDDADDDDATDDDADDDIDDDATADDDDTSTSPDDDDDDNDGCGC